PCPTCAGRGRVTPERKEEYYQDLWNTESPAYRRYIERNKAELLGRVDRERSCASCTDALPRRSIDWQGHLGVPTTRYGCAGMPCESPERENYRGRC
ncbi:MAG: hypothetical protein WC489_08210, partial [Patescibacteria group bacterium]